MKKLFIIALLIISLYATLLTTVVRAEEKQQFEYALIFDSLITTLNPYIEKEIVNHYGYIKSYDLFKIEIVRIERLNSYHLKIKLIVHTHVAAHNPPYGKETIEFDVSPSGVNTISFTHKGDEVEELIERFYDETLIDIKQSYSLNLDGYDQYTSSQLAYKAYMDEQYKPLYDIVTHIIFDTLNPEIQPPRKNIIMPVTYIKGDSGYILFKRADGRNVIYTVKKDKAKWIITKQQTKMGKKMNHELHWYM